MITSGQTRPPRPTRPPPLRPERPPQNASSPPAAPAAPRHRPSYERIFRWSVGASVVLHLLLLVLSPLILRVGEPPGLPGEDRDRFARREIQAIQPVISESAEENAAETPPLQQLPAATSATRPPSQAIVPRPGAQVPPGAVTPPGAAPSAAESARERLRTGPRDPRLWVNPRDVPLPELSDRERYQAHIQARIDALNDSMAVAAAANSRTRDWTFQDSKGRSWGIGAGGSVNLGDVRIPPGVLPRPAVTGDNQSLEREREEQRQRDEIRRQEEARQRQRQSGSGP
jgi:hypothetical protein